MKELMVFKKIFSVIFTYISRCKMKCPLVNRLWKYFNFINKVHK